MISQRHTLNLLLIGGLLLPAPGLAARPQPSSLPAAGASPAGLESDPSLPEPYPPRRW